MQIEIIEISKLKPHPKNPRVHPDSALDRLTRSIKEFGWTNPILVSADGFILAGHARLKAAEKAGLKEVPIVRLPLKGTKAEAYMIADNRLSELTSWDFPQLTDLLEEIDTGEFDIEITGFSDKEAEDLMTQFYVPSEGLMDDDEIPEKVETICKTGDLWQLGNHRLLCGDATRREDIERLMNGENADMVFTDPPYGIEVVGADGKIGGGSVRGKKYYPSQKFNKIIGDDKPFNPEHLFALAPMLLIFGANNFASRLPDSPSWLVWYKGQTANFSECELVWTNIGGRVKYYNFTWNGMTRKGIRKEELLTRVHPAQKPVGLITQILIDCKGETIIDPYGGSGSTLIACEKLGRRCFMMEISEYYTSVILKRWENFTGQKAVKIDG